MILNIYMLQSFELDPHHSLNMHLDCWLILTTLTAYFGSLTLDMPHSCSHHYRRLYVYHLKSKGNDYYMYSCTIILCCVACGGFFLYCMQDRWLWYWAPTGSNYKIYTHMESQIRHRMCTHAHNYHRTLTQEIQYQLCSCKKAITSGNRP